MMLVLYLKSFEFHEVRSSFEEKEEKRRDRRASNWTDSNTFKLVRNSSRGEREEVMVNDDVTRLERHRFFKVNRSAITVDGEQINWQTDD